MASHRPGGLQDQAAGGLAARVERVPGLVFALAGAAVAAATTLATWDPRVAKGGDNALYYALATSLHEGVGYRNLVEPGDAFETSVPWGYPALLALFMKVAGPAYLPLKWLSLGALAGAVALLWPFLVRLFGGARLPALATLLLVAVNARVTEYGSVVLSEAPFMAVSFAAVALFDATDRKGPAWRVATAAALAATTHLVRPVGIALVASLLGFLLLARRWRHLAVALGTVALVDGWWHLRSLLVPGTAPNLYLSYFVKKNKYQADDATIGAADFLSRFLHNVWEYGGDELPRLAIGHDWTLAGVSYVALPLPLLALVGFVLTLRRPSLAHLYLPLYLGVVFSWLAESVTIRYLVPGWPLLLAFVFAGAWYLPRRTWRDLAVVALAIWMGAFQVSLLAEEIPALRRVRAEVAAGDPLAGREDDWRSYVELCDWLVANTPEDAVVAGRKPRMTWFYR